MLTTTTRNASTAISQLESFDTGGALRGYRYPSTYVIHSYETMICEAYPDDARKIAFFNNAKYSVTTSRHQNEVKRGLLSAGFELLYYYNWQGFLDLVKEYEPSK
jgi:hypothetical protein